MDDLLKIIATRETAWNYTDFIGLLPDPDPILKKLPDQGFEILNSLLSDGHLTSVIQSRKLGTLKKEYKWDAGTINDEKPTNQAMAIKDQLIEDFEKIKKKKIYDLFSNILDAMLFGYVPIELIYKSVNGKIRLIDIKCLPYYWFGFDRENKAKFISINNPWEGEYLPDYKFVILKHFPSFDNPYGLRLLSRCYWPIQFKKGGIKFWIKFLEKYAIPFLFGRYPRGASKQEQNDLLNNLFNMIQDAVAVGPDGSMLDIISTKGNASGQLFQELKKEMDNEISEIILGQASGASIGEQSTLASARVVGERIEKYEESDQLLIKSAMEEIAWNYTQVNNSGVQAPVFRWYEESDPKDVFAERDKKLYSAGLRFTKEYFQKCYGYKENEIEVKADDSNYSEFVENKMTQDQEELEKLADLCIGTGKKNILQLVS